jgi:glycine cleavage system H protein
MPAGESMNVPSDLRYTDSHEWARLERDGSVSVGITWHAQDRLGDLVYVEIPAVGKSFEKGEACAVVESVKAASDIYAPVSGQVEAVNADLNSSPEKVNEDAYAAWMFRLRPSDPGQMETLLSAADYEKLIAADEH